MADLSSIKITDIWQDLQHLYVIRFASDLDQLNLTRCIDGNILPKPRNRPAKSPPTELPPIEGSGEGEEFPKE